MRREKKLRSDNDASYPGLAVVLAITSMTMSMKDKFYEARS